jgi:hypothetical protein
VIGLHLMCFSTRLSCSSKVLEISDLTVVSYSSFSIVPVLMHEYSLKVLLFGIYLHIANYDP